MSASHYGANCSIHTCSIKVFGPEIIFALPIHMYTLYPLDFTCIHTIHKLLLSCSAITVCIGFAVACCETMQMDMYVRCVLYYLGLGK